MKNLEKKAKGIFLMSPSSDQGGIYLNFCDYFRHRGILNESKAKKCKHKKCKHYQRYEPK